MESFLMVCVYRKENTWCANRERTQKQTKKPKTTQEQERKGLAEIKLSSICTETYHHRILLHQVWDFIQYSTPKGLQEERAVTKELFWQLLRKATQSPFWNYEVTDYKYKWVPRHLWDNLKKRDGETHTDTSCIHWQIHVHKHFTVTAHFSYPAPKYTEIKNILTTSGGERLFLFCKLWRIRRASEDKHLLKHCLAKWIWILILLEKIS